jgi:hypothetical protein
MQALTILEDPMTADRVLPRDEPGQRLPGLLSDVKLAVIEGGPPGIAWPHAGQASTALLGFLRSRYLAAAPPSEQLPPKE